MRIVQQLSTNRDFDVFLNLLRDDKGFDLSVYKRLVIRQQLSKRMAQLRIATIDSYIDYLSRHSQERSNLFMMLLMHAGDFFRAQDFHFLHDEVVPALIGRDREIRVWCPNCGTGQEAYSMVILLAEVLGRENFAENVCIFATDVARSILHRARRGRFTGREVKNLPPEMLTKYFRLDRHGLYMFDPRLRKSIRFVKHDTVNDPPLHDVDMVVSRNALMWFTRAAQTRALENFHDSLNNDGFLFVGPSEEPNTILFRPVEHRRLFKKTQDDGEITAESLQYIRPLLARRAFELSPFPQLVVDQNRLLVLANKAARQQFSIHTLEAGKSIDDLIFADCQLEFVPLDESPARTAGYLVLFNKPPRD